MAVNLEPKKTKPTTKPNYDYLRDKDRETVRGKFIFHEVPGGSMSFCFRKWKGDPIERYDMIDGNIYTVPLAVAKHLNSNCAYPEHQYILDENGKPKQVIKSKVRRCSFQSLEFVDIDGLESAPSIVTVENV